MEQRLASDEEIAQAAIDGKLETVTRYYYQASGGSHADAELLVIVEHEDDFGKLGVVVARPSHCQVRRLRFSKAIGRWISTFDRIQANRRNEKEFLKRFTEQAGL